MRCQPTFPLALHKQAAQTNQLSVRTQQPTRVRTQVTSNQAVDLLLLPNEDDGDADGAAPLEVAAATGAELLDLEERMDALPDPAPLFRKDGIHFTPAGRAWLGEALADFLIERVLPR